MMSRLFLIVAVPAAAAPVRGTVAQAPDAESGRQARRRVGAVRRLPACLGNRFSYGIFYTATCQVISPEAISL